MLCNRTLLEGSATYSNNLDLYLRNENLFSFSRISRAIRGWPTAVWLIILEMIVIYSVSNTPFLLSALDTPKSPDASFFSSFLAILKSDISQGQLLTFVCTLIAPVFFWCLMEPRKNKRAKWLLFFAFIVFALAMYLHARTEDFWYFSSYTLYWIALLIWFLSILFNRIPPDVGNYGDIEKTQQEGFIQKTRALNSGGENGV